MVSTKRVIISGKYTFKTPLMRIGFLSEYLFDGISYVFSIIPALNKSLRQTDTVASDLFTTFLICGNVSVFSCTNNTIMCFIVGLVRYLQINASFLGTDTS